MNYSSPEAISIVPDALVYHAIEGLCSYALHFALLALTSFTLPSMNIRPSTRLATARLCVVRCPHST